MKLLLVLLLLIFPLVSAAAAYQWVDEKGNVRFGSKPKPEKSEPAAKIEPKAPAKMSDKPIGMKPIPDKVLPTAIPASAPEARRSENPPLSTQRPQHTKPATGTMPVDSKKTPKPEPTRPVLKAIPTLTPAPVPKVEIKPTPIPAQRANKPPAAKPVPQKKKEKTVNTAPKASKKISKPPASKPAKKKPTTKKTVAAKKKTPAPKPATPATDAGTDTDKNAELCGMFTNYVSNYQNKLIGCQGVPCAIYEKSLVKYQKKQKIYCR